MSGTSADGVDAVLVEIAGSPPGLQWRLQAHRHMRWPDDLRGSILRACRGDLPLTELVRLHARLGREFASAALEIARAARVRMRSIAAIASHGQTVWHEPPRSRRDRTAGTLQLGHPAIIAARAGVPVVADFRAADMAVGGQGAPLVPFADFVMLNSPAETRAVQNIGGIGNVTYLPAGCRMEDVLAFDTGPGNMVMDALARLYSQGEQEFDQDGRMAASGAVCQPLLARMLTHLFFRQPPPRSTGREAFGEDYASALALEAERMGLAAQDVMATAAALTVESIGRAYEAWLLPRGEVETVILCGGGARNGNLVRMLSERLAPMKLCQSADFGIPIEAKEALGFAVLAYETLHGRPSNVPSATGARTPAILGAITPAPPSPARV